MLKKIVRYGNSSALVLDKALLELLNMSEGSVVKIKTDGVSLIITPQDALASQAVSPTLTVDDAIHDAVRKSLEQEFKDPEKARVFQKEMQEIMDRFMKDIQKKMDEPEMRQAIAAVQKRFAGDEANPEFSKKLMAVQKKYIPEIENMNQEMDALLKKNYSDSELPDAAVMNRMREGFAKVHEKYRHVLQAVSKLNENSEYLHESVLLAEKYQTSKNSKEFFEEQNQLIAKYFPEYVIYQEELKKMAESINAQFKNDKKTALKRGRTGKK